MLPGTVYDLQPRLFEQAGRQKNLVPLLTQLHDLAPYDVELTSDLIIHKQFAGQADGTETNLLKLSLPFSVRAMNYIADTVKSRPALYEQVMTNAASLSPNLYFTLGNIFWIEMNRIRPADILIREMRWEPRACCQPVMQTGELPIFWEKV